jgi:hypothetical protein
MRYIKIKKDEVYTMSDSATLNTKIGQWEPTKPALYSCNLREWFVHNILRKHFTFGQPYCVVCGYAELKV